MKENSKISDIKAMIALAKEHKVHRVQMGDLVIEMSPYAFMSEQSIEDIQKAMAPDVCPCGHEHSDHNALGCLHGCDHEACAPPENGDKG